MSTKSLDTIEKVSAAVLAVGVLVSAVMFVGAVNDKANANSERMDRQKEKIQRMEGQQDVLEHEIHNALNEILQRVTRIEQYQKDKE